LPTESRIQMSTTSLHSNKCLNSCKRSTRAIGIVARGGHVLPQVPPGPAMPYPLRSAGPPRRRAGGLRPSSIPLYTPRRTPMQVDVICNLLPSTAKTVDLLSGDVLSHCKVKRPLFINIGRGDVIDEVDFRSKHYDTNCVKNRITEESRLLDL
jgi:hypothetical protein